ncbi:MAG: translation elongation factor Ts [Planctomycetota bacterium]
MSSEISAAQVKELREQTGAGLMECKKALGQAEGNIEKAKEILRLSGIHSAGKKAGRETREGLIGSYVHHNGKIGVLVEVNCETDFVARTEDFQALIRDIAMHIAAMSPTYVSREEVPKEIKEKELSLIRGEMGEQLAKKPLPVQEKILDGKMVKFYAERCLLDQPFCKDDSKTVGELVKETIGKLGENMQVRRFHRIEVGG